MSLRGIGSGRTKTRAAWVALLCVAILPLLAARSVPPIFKPVSSSHSAVHVVDNHDQRPRFECARIHWSTPSAEFQFNVPAVETLHASASAQPLPFLTPQGSHYNRPPPLS